VRKQAINYNDPKLRDEILIRQRKGIWTPEQISSFAKHFKLKPGIRLLDAGCGFGYILRAYGSYCMPRGMLVGFDLEAKLLKTARIKSTAEKLGQPSCFVTGDVYELPFADNSFNISIAHVLLCHLKQPERTLDELIRVTQRGGCIAIFDNAIAEFGGGWSNWLRPTIKQKAFNYELRLRSMQGRKKWGRGDFRVGCYIAHWMEKRGLKNVDVRCNEKVYWIAPPYKSPAQKLEYHKQKERLTEPYNTTTEEFKTAVQCMRKGGMDELNIRKAIRHGREHHRKFRVAFRKGTLSYATSSGQFWCTWGFKP
jgi:ubiquinone/menaquinone biosynthesis C-methylase UbiE